MQAPFNIVYQALAHGAMVDAMQLGAISMVKRDGTRCSRIPLKKRLYVFGPGENCDVRINVQHAHFTSEQAHIDIDENNQVRPVCDSRRLGRRLDDVGTVFSVRAWPPPQAWFTPLGGAAIVSHAPVQSRCRLEDNALIEIGTRCFVYHTGSGDPDASNPPSQPASPFSRGCRDGSPPRTRDKPHGVLPLAELPILPPHPSPGGAAAKHGAPPQCNPSASPSARIGMHLSSFLSPRGGIGGVFRQPSPTQAGGRAPAAAASSHAAPQPARDPSQPLAGAQNLRAGTGSPVVNDENNLNGICKSLKMHAPPHIMQRSMLSPIKAWLDKDKDQHAAPRAASIKPLCDAQSSPHFSGLRLEAEADAQRIRAEAQARASQILALAEADAQRIRDEAEADAQRIRDEAKARVVQWRGADRHASAVQRSAARKLWPNLPDSQRTALAQAERCMAFVDKMVCLNFLQITRDSGQEPEGPESDQQIALQDARTLLQKAGFALDDVDEILQLAKEMDSLLPEQRINIPETLSSATPKLGPLPPRPSRENLPGPSSVGADLIEEDLPSTPGTRALQSARTPWQKGLEMLQTMSPRGGGLQAGDCATASPRDAGPRTDRAFGLHPAIRKHPILNWLQKYDPTKDKSLVSVKPAAPDSVHADPVSPSRYAYY